MIMNRLVIVPDEKHEALGAEIMPRLTSISREIDANNLVGLLIPEALAMLEKSAKRDDGLLLVWAAEGKGFAPAWATERIPKDIASRARADSGEGLIAQVFGSGRAAASGADELEISEWSNLESVIGEKVSAMSASPVFVYGNCVAAVVLTTTKAVDEAPLPPSEISGLLAKLIEGSILRAVLGIESI